MLVLPKNKACALRLCLLKKAIAMGKGKFINQHQDKNILQCCLYNILVMLIPLLRLLYVPKLLIALNNKARQIQGRDVESLLEKVCSK